MERALHLGGLQVLGAGVHDRCASQAAPRHTQYVVDFLIKVSTPGLSEVRGRWQWASLVVFLGAAQSGSLRVVGLTAQVVSSDSLKSQGAL